MAAIKSEVSLGIFVFALDELEVETLFFDVLAELQKYIEQINNVIHTNKHIHT